MARVRLTDLIFNILGHAMFERPIDVMTMEELKEVVAAEGLEYYLTPADRQELEHLRLKFIYQRDRQREMEALPKNARTANEAAYSRLAHRRRIAGMI